MTASNREPIRHAVITGGAGAIGSRLVRRVLADGAESAMVVDDLSSGYRWLLPDDARGPVEPPREHISIESLVQEDGSGMGFQVAPLSFAPRAVAVAARPHPQRPAGTSQGRAALSLHFLSPGKKCKESGRRPSLTGGGPLYDLGSRRSNATTV